MAVEPDLLSEAVVALVGVGRSSFPIFDEDAARAVAGVPDSVDLAAEAAVIVQEALAIPIDWEAVSLADAGEVVRQEMAVRHPELSPDALQALAWKFTFDWR